MNAHSKREASSMSRLRLLIGALVLVTAVVLLPGTAAATVCTPHSPANPPPTSGNDVLGNPTWGQPERLEGLAGNDILYGSYGYGDYLCGNQDTDIIWGDYGDEDINAGDGPDTIHGQGNADLIHGGSLRDDIYGEAGGDNLFGDDYSDNLYGGNGTDWGDGGAGTDYCNSIEHPTSCESF